MTVEGHAISRNGAKKTQEGALRGGVGVSRTQKTDRTREVTFGSDVGSLFLSVEAGGGGRGGEGQRKKENDKPSFSPRHGLSFVQSVLCSATRICGSGAAGGGDLQLDESRCGGPGAFRK